MQNRNRRTNFFLLLIALLLCGSCGYLLRQSSPDLPGLSQGKIELFASQNHINSVVSNAAESPVEEESTSDAEPTAEADVSTTAPSPTPTKFEPSPEASKGVWTSSGSNWMFMVDGTPHTGWLTDTDGKRYYFNNEGIMQTGWVDADGKRYYMDLDGIMQTGFITTGGKSYQLLEDGSLKDYQPESTEETN